MPTVSFEQLGIWIVCAVLALDVLLRVAAHQREKKTAEEGTSTLVSPQPLQVKRAEEFVTKEAHADMKREVEKLDTERRTSVAKIHDKVEAQGTRLARVEEKTDSQTRQLHALDGKIDRILERLPTHK